MTRTISHFKHNPQVMIFLQEQKMWISNDMFKTQKITTVGRIIEVPPRLMWVPGYIKKLTKAMKEVKMPAVDIVKWRVQTKVIEIDQNANEVSVPPFNLVPWNYEWGNGKGRVETMMLNVERSENGATYLKALLSEICHFDKFEQGQIIPKGIHLMTNVETLKALMSAQNKYLEEVVNIPVIEIPSKAFKIPESSKDKSSKLMNMMNSTEMFWGVEETPQSKYLGKYHFITDIENKEKGKYFTDNTLKQWIKSNME
jgi:hypothetical protein